MPRRAVSRGGLAERDRSPTAWSSEGTEGAATSDQSTYYTVLRFALHLKHAARSEGATTALRSALKIRRSC